MPFTVEEKSDSILLFSPLTMDDAAPSIIFPEPPRIEAYTSDIVLFPNCGINPLKEGLRMCVWPSESINLHR